MSKSFEVSMLYFTQTMVHDFFYIEYTLQNLGESHKLFAINRKEYNSFTVWCGGTLVSEEFKMESWEFFGGHIELNSEQFFFIS